MQNTETLNNRLSDIRGDIRKLEGQSETIKTMSGKMKMRYAEIEHLLSLKDETSEVLSRVLSVAQKDAVGRYESMLTALCRDVLRSNIGIKFVLGVSRGRPSLDIKANNGGDEVEDIFDGRGGSLTNIVSTGLRYIVLTRMQELRQFIVLDEADCWISPKSVGKFNSVVRQMSEDMNVQSLSISHHSKDTFPSAHVIDLDYDDMMGRVFVDEQPDFEWDDQPGIRKIHLKNFMSHQDTEINLSPYSNIITGPNDVGKSAIVRALRAVSYNAGSDDMVRHGQKEATVDLTVEGGQILRWTRKSKGSAKTAYFLFDKDGSQLRHTVEGKDVPDWVMNILKIDTVCGFDVHIGHQKQPLFLINETPSKRAEILAIGKDTQYIQAMCANYAKLCNEHKREMKRLETEVGKLDFALTTLSKVLFNLNANQEDLDSDFKLYKESVAAEKHLNDTMFRVINSSKIDNVNHIDGLHIFEFDDVTPLHNAILACQRASVEVKLIDSVDAIEFEDVSELQHIVDTLNVDINVPDIKPVKLPEMQKVTDIFTVISKITTSEQSIHHEQDAINTINDRIKETEEEIHEATVKDNCCVVCGRPY